MAATSLSKFMSRRPVVVICGATGTGKSKLAVELAKKFNGEVISADSMQVYQGLDIITNKVTVEEQCGVPHHMLNFVNPLTGITVIDFRNNSLKIIEDIINRNKLPILAGGTMYYVESILYDILLPNVEEDPNPAFYRYHCSPEENSDLSSKIKELERKLKNMSNEELYQRMATVDPEMAIELHPGDRRKALRCLELYETTGQKMSELLKRQRTQPGGSEVGGPLRFPNSAILWLQCDKKTLDERLDERVDGMLRNGLIEELLGFHEKYNRRRFESGASPDYTLGIFQSIGFKEFHEYLILSRETRDSDSGKKLLEECVDNLKLVTRRYAKKQLKWIVNRFLRRAQRQVPPIYGLDATDLSLWDEKVLEPAENVVSSLLSGQKPCLEPLPLTNESKPRKIYRCDICNKHLHGLSQLEHHLKGSKHKKMSKKKSRPVEAQKESE